MSQNTERDLMSIQQEAVIEYLKKENILNAEITREVLLKSSVQQIVDIKRKYVKLKHKLICIRNLCKKNKIYVGLNFTEALSNLNKVDSRKLNDIKRRIDNRCKNEKSAKNKGREGGVKVGTDFKPSKKRYWLNTKSEKEKVNYDTKSKNDWLTHTSIYKVVYVGRMYN